MTLDVRSELDGPFADAFDDHFDGYPAGLVEGRPPMGRPLFARLLDALAGVEAPGEWGAGPRELEAA